MENLLNELKLKLNEMNDLINDFEITKLKNDVKNDVDFSNLTAEQLEEIHRNYDILDIYTRNELFGAAADEAECIEDVFDIGTIKDSLSENNCKVFEDDDELIEYVYNNFYPEDLIDISWRN